MRTAKLSRRMLILLEDVKTSRGAEELLQLKDTEQNSAFYAYAAI